MKINRSSMAFWAPLPEVKRNNMACFLGIDTSNYTTSCAIYDSESDTIIQKKKLLPVKHGEIGLRQSDAVFHHTVQLPVLLRELFADFDGKVDSVGVSEVPVRAEGSYMPCFLAGVSAAEASACTNNLSLYKYSHQQGHLMAALFSAGKRDLYGHDFLAFHVSGGTTQLLKVSGNLETTLVATSLDLKAGQAVDRVGVMLGFSFPAGRFVDELASKSENKYKINVKLNEGNCNLSGVENKCKDMFRRGEKPEDICRFCIDYIIITLEKMMLYALDKYGDMPVLFSGGVMSNSIIKKYFTEKYGSFFAEPEFSSDNAAGIAILAAMEKN